MGGVIVYVDWENAWLEHLHTMYPGLGRPLSTDSVLPAVTTMTPDILADLKRFPSLVVDAIQDQFGQKPILVSAAALWKELTFCTDAGFPDSLAPQNFEVHSPVCPAKYSTPKERENFCDAYLIVQMLNDWFVDDRNTSIGFPSGRFSDDVVSDIVIVSGDNIFCQAAEFFHRHAKVNITFFTWSTCISRHILAQASTLPRVFYRYVDKNQKYRQAVDVPNRLDALRRYKSSRKAKYFDTLINTAACRLLDHRHRDVPVEKFKKWMENWIHYWRTVASLQFPHSAGTLDRQFNHLRQRGVIVDSKIGNVPAIRLDRKSSLVKRVEAQIKENKYGFEFYYDVPPVYHSKPARRR